MVRTNAITLALVVACFWLASGAHVMRAPIRSAGPEKIPFRMSEGGLILIPVTVGDNLTREFILDLGAGLHVIAPGLLRELAATPRGFYGAVRMTGERIDLDLFEIPAIQLGSLRQPHPVVGSWSLLDSLGVGGLLSAKLFENRVVTLDFTRRELSFDDGPTLTQRLSGATKVPLLTSSDRDIALDLFAEFGFVGGPEQDRGRSHPPATDRSRDASGPRGSVTGQCELDTGLDGFVVNSRYMKLMGVEPQGEGVEKIEKKSLTGRTEVRYRTSIVRISLVAAPSVQMKSPRVDFQDIRYDCAVGVQFWLGRVLTLNIAQRYLLVSKDRF